MDSVFGSNVPRAPSVPEGGAAGASVSEGSPGDSQGLTSPAVEGLTGRVEAQTPNLTSLTDQHILAKLEELRVRAEQLDRELVIDGEFSPPGARRTIEEWRVDQAAFKEIQSTVGQLYRAEAIRRGICGDMKPYFQVVRDIEDCVKEAIASHDFPILRLMALHVPAEFHDHLLCANRGIREMAAVEWKFPFENEPKARRFLDAIVLEREREGQGVAFLKGQRMKAKPAVKPDGSAVQPPLGLIATFKRLMSEDAFRLPRVWRGEFSFIKPPEKRAANPFAN